MKQTKWTVGINVDRDIVVETYADNDQDLETNAHLIAAAQALLKACRARVDEWHANNRNFSRVEPASLKLARAAIAKVKLKANG